MTVVDLAEDGVLLEDLVAGSEHHVGMQQATEEEMASLLHLFSERSGIAEEVICRLELAEPGGRGVEEVAVGGQHR